MSTRTDEPNSKNKSDSDDIQRDRSKIDFVSEGRFYPDNPTHEKHKKAFQTKASSQFYEPCAEASQMSLKCLERNNYDKSKCVAYFQAYRDCKRAFLKYRKQDQQENGPW